MSNPRKKQASTLLLAGLGAILLLVLMASGVIFHSQNATALVSDNTQLASSVVCTNSVHYYSNDAPAGSNFFGPAVTQTSVDGQLQELLNRRQSDPALVVAHSKYEGIGDYPSLVGDQLTVRANQLAADPTAWCAAIKALQTNEMGKPASDVQMSGSYQTMYMVKLPQGAPLIEATSPDRPSFMVLQIGSWNLKLDCGFQPVAQQFQGVIHLTSFKPSTSVNCCNASSPPPGAGGCTSNCVGPPTTVPPHQCHVCTTPEQVKIPVHSQNPGVDVGPTPGAPTTPPSISPGPPSLSAPLPPNAGGYDTGSASGSGTSGGSTCDANGCTGLGPTPPPGPPATSSVSGQGIGTQSGSSGGTTSTGGGTLTSVPQ